jgi:hypothetical protein
LQSEKTYPADCLKVAGVANTVNMTGIALRPNQHILVSACGFPIILTLDKNTTNVNIIKVINQVGGGDEVWYNPGDDRFYVTGLDMTTTTGVQSLGVINAQTSEWLQNVPDVRGKNPAALPANNHIFTIVQITAAIAAGTAPDDSICFTAFNFKGTGCVAVFQGGSSSSSQQQVSSQSSSQQQSSSQRQQSISRSNSSGISSRGSSNSSTTSTTTTSSSSTTSSGRR